MIEELKRILLSRGIDLTGKRCFDEARYDSWPEVEALRILRRAFEDPEVGLELGLEIIAGWIRSAWFANDVSFELARMAGRRQNPEGDVQHGALKRELN